MAIVLGSVLGAAGVVTVAIAIAVVWRAKKGGKRKSTLIE
jgi:hypothetical protein